MITALLQKQTELEFLFVTHSVEIKTWAYMQS